MQVKTLPVDTIPDGGSEMVLCHPLMAVGQQDWCPGLVAWSQDLGMQECWARLDWPGALLQTPLQG